MAEEYYVSTAAENRALYVPTFNRPHIVDLKLKNGEERPVYHIDLTTRTINGPDVLSCRQDHNAELIIFSVDRYHNQFDLAECCCVIQFTTINSKTNKTFVGLYPVQYYDIISKSSENLILIPWEIPIDITQTATEVEYNIRFYQLAPIESEYYPDLVFNLNTRSTTATIINTLSVGDDRLNGQYANFVNLFKANPLDSYNYDILLSRVINAYDNTTLCWKNAEDPDVN